MNSQYGDWWSILENITYPNIVEFCNEIQYTQNFSQEDFVKLIYLSLVNAWVTEVINWINVNLKIKYFKKINSRCKMVEDVAEFGNFNITD